MAFYYIETTGSNSNSGLADSPWLTLGYACENTTDGDIIHVGIGTFIENQQCILEEGVSIEGTGDTSIILSHVAGSVFTIYANSGSENANGNQHISNIKMDGDSLTAYGAIRVNHRGNVEIDNCTIINFNYYGVSFINGEPPSVYATGNTFHDNIVTNCSIYAGGSRGCLELQGQDGIDIYGNTMDADRGTGNSGDVIYAVEGFLKNVKIHDNTLIKTHYPGVSSWDFAIELWNVLGGVEIYNNIITGSVDLVNCTKGASTYSAWVHDNIIGQTSLQASEPVRGVLMETASAGSPAKPNMKDVIIERNYIHDVCVGVILDQINGYCALENIRISYNIFNNIGMVGTNSKGWGIYFTNEGVWENTVDNFQVWNNVFIGYTGLTTTMWGIQVPDSGAVTNVSIRNNIVKNFDYGPTYGSASGKTGVSVDVLSIENNIFYGNGNSNNPRYNSLTPTNNTTQNNITTDPLLVSGSDFHLQAGSPGIDAGIDVGLTTDFDSIAVSDPPEIGVYEYGTPAILVTDITVTGAGGATTITTDDGTLQMSAHIDPHDADMQTVTWSVTNGTGSGVINSSGLLTAYSDGTVTVTATAQDGSGVFGTLGITISGQSTGGLPGLGLRDRDGNLYTSVVIGTKEYLIGAFRVTHYADGSPILNITDGGSSTYTDWFLPSKDELNEMYVELHLHSVGNFQAALYWSSTEEDDLRAWWQNFATGAQNFTGKSTTYVVRPIRAFTSATSYSLRDIGPAGGWIFYKSGDDYLEAAANDETPTHFWSNIADAEIGVTAQGTAIGTGQANTTAIISQVGHTDSSAKLCSDLSVTPSNGWANDTSGAYCWYNNDIANKTPYGALYNWYAYSNPLFPYIEKDGIPQAGWRLPATQAELIELYTVLGGSDVAGAKMKEVGLTHWNSPNDYATNSSGFTAVGTGHRIWSGGFSNQKENTYMPSLEEGPAESIYFMLLYHDSAAVSLDYYGLGKSYGYPVYLMRDYSEVPPPPPPPPVPPTFENVIPYNYGNLPEYRFYISTAYTGSAISIEVFPLKFLSTSLVYELEGDQVFYRKKFSGSLLFGTNSKVLDSSGIEQNRRDDWNYFWGIEQITPDEKLYLTIIKSFGGVVCWEGYFSTTDGKFDIDNCTFEVTPLVIDDYTDVLDKSGVQYDILIVPSMGIVSMTFMGMTYDYSRTRWLARLGSNNVLEYIVHKICGAGAIVQSDFFTDAMNPVTLADNKLLYLTIAQKSDILRWTSTDPAHKVLMSFKDLMDILWGVFRVRWKYDLLTNTFRIEHTSWFTHTSGIDLRTQLSCYATNKYSYLKDKMPKYEKLTFMEAGTSNFKGVPIWYDSGAVNQDPESNISETILKVTTDIEHIILNPDGIADEGFVIFCNYELGGSYFIESTVGAYSTNVGFNMRLSAANLENAYHKHERVLMTGYMNDVLQTFLSARKTKQQECSAILCDDLDPEGEITTELGETYFGGAKATIKSASISPTGETKFTLLYGPIPETNPGTPDEKYIRITQDEAVLFGSLTELSLVDVEVVLHLTDCDGNPQPDETWTCTAGNINFTDHVIMHQLIVSISVTTAGWTLDFDYDIDYECV